MTNFEYAISIKEITKTKTFKSLDHTVRKLERILASYRWKDITNNNKEVIINTYKCFTFALHRLSTSSTIVPEYIHKTNIDIHHKLLVYITTNGSSTHSDILNIFEYVNYIDFPNNNGDIIKRFARIVGANTHPFEIIHRMYTDAFHNSILSQAKIKSASKLTMVLQVEEMKRSLPITTTYTILEEYLDILYNDAEMTLLDTLEAGASDAITIMQNALTNTLTVHQRVLSQKPTSS